MLSSKLPSQQALKPARASSRVAVVRHAVKRQNDLAPVVSAVPAALLACSLIASGLDYTVLAPPVHADEEIDESRLSPYERRQLQMQKRRELLQKAREDAEAKKAADADAAEAQATAADEAVEAANAERKSAASGFSTNLRARALSAYEDAAKTNTSRFGGLSAPPPPSSSSSEQTAAVDEEPASSMSSMTSMFKFEAPKFEAPKFEAPKFEAPAPPPPPPAPRPAPVVQAPPPPPPPPAPKPVEVKKAEAPKPAPAPVAKSSDSSSKKRKGPLPLWLAEFMVLGSFAGTVAAVTKYSSQSAKALAALQELAKKAAASLPK